MVQSNKIDNQMIKFINNPNKTNFREVLDNSLFGYFHPNYVDIGRRYISNISIDYKFSNGDFKITTHKLSLSVDTII